MKIRLIVLVVAMMTANYMGIPAYASEGVPFNVNTVMLHGMITAIPCGHADMAEGKPCIEIYLEPRAHIEFYQAHFYGDGTLSYDRVKEVIIPNETESLTKQDTFEASLLPGKYIISIHDGLNGHDGVFGPLDVLGDSKTVDLNVEMYNHTNGVGRTDETVPREICLTYTVTTPEGLMPTSTCVTDETYVKALAKTKQ